MTTYTTRESRTVPVYVEDADCRHTRHGSLTVPAGTVFVTTGRRHPTDSTRLVCEATVEGYTVTAVVRPGGPDTISDADVWLIDDIVIDAVYTHATV